VRAPVPHGGGRWWIHLRAISGADKWAVLRYVRVIELFLKSSFGGLFTACASAKHSISAIIRELAVSNEIHALGLQALDRIGGCKQLLNPSSG
jgi:hypothetical protein